MAKKKRRHERSRSRSRSSSPKRRRDHAEKSSRGRHHRSSSGERRSRRHSPRSPGHSSRSTQRARSRSNSPSRERSSRSGRSRSRERRRSWSRERKRERRTRGRSQSHDRSHRSRSQERTVEHRSGDSTERRRSRSRERSDSPHQASLPVTEHRTQETSRDLSKEIPGFDSMTPLERIKAKIRLMVEKSQGSQSSEEHSQTFVPSPSQLASLESDAFEPASFSSTRVPGKSQASSTNDGGKVRSTQHSSTADDEFAPQVVDLSNANGIKQPVAMDTNAHSNVSLERTSKEDKKTKWLKRLQQLREKHGPPS